MRDRVAALNELAREAGRGPAELSVAVALREPDPADVLELAALGVTELVLVEGPPEDPAEARAWTAALARRWRPTAD